MKKIFPQLLLLSIISFTVMISCSKTEVQDQLRANNDENELTDARGHHGGQQGGNHGGHHGPWHNGHNCHNPHCNVPGCPNNTCPTAVPTTAGFTYELDYNPIPGFVWIQGTVTYTNNGPAGSMSFELKDANLIVDTSWISPAPHTNAGEVGTIQFQRHVNNNFFPYFLTAEGRPADLQCTIRSNIEFVITGASKAVASH